LVRTFVVLAFLQAHTSRGTCFSPKIQTFPSFGFLFWNYTAHCRFQLFSLYFKLSPGRARDFLKSATRSVAQILAFRRSHARRRRSIGPQRTTGRVCTQLASASTL
jgi:hypothetical protein